MRFRDAVVTFNRANDGSEKSLMFLPDMALSPTAAWLPDLTQTLSGPGGCTTVELIRIELTTSGLQSPRSPS